MREKDRELRRRRQRREKRLKERRKALRTGQSVKAASPPAETKTSPGQERTPTTSPPAEG